MVWNLFKVNTEDNRRTSDVSNEIDPIIYLNDRNGFINPKFADSQLVRLRIRVQLLSGKYVSLRKYILFRQNSRKNAKTMFKNTMLILMKNAQYSL